MSKKEDPRSLAENSGFPFFWYNYTEYFCVDFENEVYWNVKTPGEWREISGVTDFGIFVEIKELRERVRQEELSKEILKIK